MISSTSSWVVLAIVALLLLAIPMRTGSGASGGRNGREVARINDGHGVGHRSVGVHGGKARRRRAAGHERKISFAILGRTHIVIIVGSRSRTGTGTGLGRDSRRGPGRCRVARNVDDEGLVDGLLAIREEFLQNGAYVLFRAQDTRNAVTSIEAKAKVGRVVGLAQRICVFSQNHVAHVIDKVVWVDGNERGRGFRPHDPNLARSLGHAATIEIVAYRRGIFNVDEVGVD
jgi:hypothetical protein